MRNRTDPHLVHEGTGESRPVTEDGSVLSVFGKDTGRKVGEFSPNNGWSLKRLPTTQSHASDRTHRPTARELFEPYNQ